MPPDSAEKRSCNLHDDCDQTERDVREYWENMGIEYKGMTHCHEPNCAACEPAHATNHVTRL